MIVGYKYRIKDKSAKKQLLKQAYAVNQVWNYCNAYQENIYNKYKAGAKKRPWPTHFDFHPLVKGVGKELKIPQNTVGEVCRLFVKNRNSVGRPLRYRASFGSNRSLGFIPFQEQNRRIEGNSVKFNKKWYRFFGNNRRPIPANVKSGCFVEDSLGRWYVCFNVDEDKQNHLNDKTSIGVDLGLKSFATLSNGEVIKAPQYFRKLEQKLVVQQKARNKKRVKRIYAKIKNQRHDFLHKLSTELAARHSLIAVGNVKSLSLAKTRMAKSTYDASWYAFKSMLRYKATNCVEVDERFTTQTCSHCGSKDSDERPIGIAGLGIRRWKCSDCGEIHDRDVNAAKNILIAALSTQRRVDESLFP